MHYRFLIAKSYFLLMAWLMCGVLVACQESPTPNTPSEEVQARTTLATNITRWGQSNLNNNSYNFVIKRSCFCAEETTTPVKVTVIDGEVSTRTYTTDDTPVPTEHNNLFVSVDGLFSLIRDALDQKAHKVTVVYDPTYGFPTSISIDYHKDVADDELSITLNTFEILLCGVVGCNLPDPELSACTPFEYESDEYLDFATKLHLAPRNSAATPVQVCVRAVHSNGCIRNIYLHQQREGTTITLLKRRSILYGEPGACIQVFTPYAQWVTIDTSGLSSDTYTIAFKDIRETFTYP